MRVKICVAKEMVTIGKITSPFGLKGAVKVYPHTDFIDRIYKLKQVQVESEGGEKNRLVIEDASVHQRLWVVKFKDCDTREAAKRLCGALVKIEPQERIVLPEGHFYFDQIIGLHVCDMNGNLLGEITGVLRTGGNDVYQVRLAEEDAAREILIPALKEVVTKIDLENAVMTVSLPEGLV